MDAKNLPYSSLVDISKFLQTFDNTAASYKYIFFLSLLDVLEKSDFSQVEIALEEILLEMLVNAWYPHTYFRLNFGVNDRIARELDRLNLNSESDVVKASGSSRDALRKLIYRRPFTQNQLLDLVPYRLLTPFFRQELKGLKDAQKNRRIVELTHDCFTSIRPFYMFSESQKHIIMHHNWLMYFYENHAVIRSFIAWNWLDYMQRRNPSVPNIKEKLFPVGTRASLTSQREFWKTVLTARPFQCIYTRKNLSAQNISIDHFLPWTFVAHDRLWNLIPTAKAVNSAKSNNLPDRGEYLEGFLKMQYQGLSVFHHTASSQQWNTVIEPYISDLGISKEQLLDRDVFFQNLRETINPLFHIARRQGFPHGWRYAEGA